MKVLSTHTAVVSEEEYLNGIGHEFSALFVRGNEGTIFKRLTLKGNRTMLVPAKKCPEETKLTWDLSAFLPTPGGLPYDILLQTVSFFQKVSKKLGGSSQLEAFVFLCWSEEKGYFINVPVQSVGGASVTYNWEDHPDVLLLGDIHSHNTMSSFWSGTDNADDSKKLGISGVIGDMKGGPLDFTSKWRFCCGDGVMIDLQITDIFQVPEAPDAWLEQVKQGHGAVGGYRGTWVPPQGQTPYSGYGYGDDGLPLGGENWWEVARRNAEAERQAQLPTAQTSAFNPANQQPLALPDTGPRRYRRNNRIR